MPVSKTFAVEIQQMDLPQKEQTKSFSMINAAVSFPCVNVLILGAYGVAINATATQDFVALTLLPECTGVAETAGVPAGETPVTVTNTGKAGLILPTVTTSGNTIGDTAAATNSPSPTGTGTGTKPVSNATGSAGSGNKSGATHTVVNTGVMAAVLCTLFGISLVAFI
jgi:hypothetical protein